MQWLLLTLAAGGLLQLSRKVVALMAQFADLDADLDSLATGVAELATLIQDLKTQPVPVTQAQLDAAVAKTDAIQAAIEAAKQ